MCEQHIMKRLSPCLTLTALAALAIVPLGLHSAFAQEKGDRGLGAAADSRFIDHSLLVAAEYPCTWPSHPFPRFSLTHQRTIGPDSPYNVDSLLIDGNTGTQLDVPTHSVARPELKREKSGPFGYSNTDKIEGWQSGG